MFTSFFWVCLTKTTQSLIREIVTCLYLLVRKQRKSGLMYRCSDPKFQSISSPLVFTTVSYNRNWKYISNLLSLQLHSVTNRSMYKQYIKSITLCILGECYFPVYNIDSQRTIRKGWDEFLCGSRSRGGVINVGNVYSPMSRCLLPVT